MDKENTTVGRKDYDNGTYYEGELLDNRPNGQGTYYFKNGKYIGSFKNGKYHGPGEIHIEQKDEDRFYFDNGEYIEDDVSIGTWTENKKNGRFINYFGGLPYDQEYLDDKPIKSKLYYDIPMPNDTIFPNTLRCLYGGQSCFVIETTNSTLIFDWYRSSLPTLRKDKPIYVFISHVHGDHYHSRIFDLVYDYNSVKFYMGLGDTSDEKYIYEKRLSSLPSEIDDNIEFLSGDEQLETEFGEIETLNSTDLGVAFIIRIDGFTLYHAGDLFWQNGGLGSMKEFRNSLIKKDPQSIFITKEEIKNQYEGYFRHKTFIDQYGNTILKPEERFKKYIEPLSGLKIDYAMLPMDPRFGSYGFYTVEEYLKISNIRYFTPMHLWEQLSYASKFAKEHPNLASKMISVNPDYAALKQTIEINIPYTVDLS